MTDVPNRLIIVNGNIKMEDGSCLKSYLKKYQSDFKIGNGEPINIVEHLQLEELWSSYLLATLQSFVENLEKKG